MEEGQKWSCEYCTYENWPAAKKCVLCRAPRPPQLITQAVSESDKDIYKMAPLVSPAASNSSPSMSPTSGTSAIPGCNSFDPLRKWPCAVCTYLNWPKSVRCTQCLTPRLKMSPASNSSPSMSPTSGTSAIPVCNSFDPLRKWPCGVCTYVNWPKSVRCTQCLTPRLKMSPVASPSQERQLSPLSVNVNIAAAGPKPASPKPSPTSPESTKEINNDKNRLVAGKHGKWTCKSCTYDNWPKSQKCVICNASRPRPYEPGATGGHSPQIISPDEDKNGIKRGSTQSLTSLSSSHTDSIEQLAGATASPKVYEENINNRVGDRKMKQIRNRLRESDWLWLNACQGVVDGDARPVEAYISSKGDTGRQLTQEEVIVLNRPGAFERGYTLMHIAVLFQREDLLALLLTQTEAPCKAVKRVPSHVSPDLAAEVRRDVATSVRQRKGDFPCYFLMECVTFALPAEIEDLPRPIQKQLFDELLDGDVQKELEVEEPIINWSHELTTHLGSRLYALWNRTAGDCLLDSVLQATWGIFDRDNTLRRALSDSLSEGASMFYPRWKEFESMQAQSLFTLDESQWHKDWAILLSLASQPGASLEQTHIFALAHILRRPIIVYGVKFVKSFRGETLGYARFQGVYLPLLWEPSFCWKTPICLGYTRGHFSALVPMETDNDRNIGASSNIDSSNDTQITYLPLIDSEGKLLPVNFLSPAQIGKEEAILKEWLDCCVTDGGHLVAKMKIPRRPTLVRQMVDEWLDFYRRMAQNMRSSPPNPQQALDSDGESDED